MSTTPRDDPGVVVDDEPTSGPELREPARRRLSPRQLHERRRVSRQLDQLLDCDRYPDVGQVYSVRTFIGEAPRGGKEPAA